MTNLRYGNLWRILEEYKFDIMTEISADLTCTICKKILKNACNGPCGCRYCLECIKKYLNGEEKHCPEDFEECKEELLNLDQNIFLDNAANNRISRLSVKCPEKTCDFQDSLKRINDHIKVCDKKIMKCPYYDIGCNESKLASDKMNDHLIVDNYTHTKSLMNCIQNLKNEMALMKESLEEMKRVKDESQKKQYVIMDMQQKIGEFKKKFNQKTEENIHLKMKLEETEEKLDGMRLYLEKKQDNIESQLIEILLDNEKRKFKSEENHRFAETLYGKLEFLEKETNSIKQHYGSITWKIENFTQKRKEALIGVTNDIYSEPFYSHKYGYKMCLQLHPDGFKSGKGTHLSVFFFIMRGENDAILPWPMKLEVSIGIINQESGDIHTSFKFNYDPVLDKYRHLFDKPKSDINIGYGYDFIRLDELVKNNKLLRSDKIVLKCTVGTVKEKKENQL